jgi:hypothetical protein
MEKCFTKIKSLFLPLGGCFIIQNAGRIVLFLPLCPAGIRAFKFLLGGVSLEGGASYRNLKISPTRFNFEKEKPKTDASLKKRAKLPQTR